MSTYSANTFIFNMETKRKFNVTDKAYAVCQQRYGPCFGRNDLYFDRNDYYRYRYRYRSYDDSTRMYTARSMSSFGDFGRYFRGEEVIIEVYYRVL